jgi:hypothetical protein
MEPGSIAVSGSGRDQSRWWRRVGRRSLLAGGAAAVLVAAGAGIGLASIPSSTGVFHGCYVKSSGALRVIDPSAHQHCKRGELAVSWNQAGQRGPKGPRGPRGNAGPAGSPGLAFTTGTGQDSPNLGTPGTYFIVVKAALENNTQNPLTGTCGIGDPTSGNVQGFGQPFVIPRGATGIDEFSGMLTVTQGPAKVQVNCTVDDASGTAVPQGADPTWWVAKLPG